MPRVRPYTRCARCIAKLADRGVGHEPYLCFDCSEKEAFVMVENIKGVRKSVRWLLLEYQRMLDEAGVRPAVSDDAPDRL